MGIRETGEPDGPEWVSRSIGQGGGRTHEGNPRDGDSRGMTPEAALIELLARVAASQGCPVLVNEEELGHWPEAAVKAMKSQKLLARARPAASVVCPGCERECVMPVHTLPARPGGSPSFIVCDKRNDINRVPVAAARLKQWQSDIEGLCAFVAKGLELRRSPHRLNNAGMHEIGTARGKNRSQMLCVQAKAELKLVAGYNAIPLAELVRYQAGGYSIDRAGVRQLVDATSTADSRYTPSNARREAHKLDTQGLHEGWRKEYRALKKKRPEMSDVWYSQQIARGAIAKGRSAETIRKHMTK